MTKLKIQTLLELHGLDHVKEYLKLDVKEKGNLVLLKYRQLEADWSKPALLECRGIILDRDNYWKVVSYPYEKFFNIGEGYCAAINWDNVKFYEKSDGSLTNLYFYNGKWHVQTSGVIDGDAQTNHVTMRFNELFWNTVEIVYGSVYDFTEKLNTNYNYMFELCTPWNIVVTPHEDYTIKLHGVRDMTTYEWVDIDSIDLLKVKTYNLKSLNDMYSKLEDMPWMEEGFVVFDGVNRAKIKNPKYVAVHHTVTGVSPYAIVNVIKTNEIDEYLAYFKHKADDINFIKENWDAELKRLQDIYNTVKNIDDQKEFALAVFASGLEKSFTGIMFAMRNNNIADIHAGMCKLDNRFWYNRFYKTNI